METEFLKSVTYKRREEYEASDKKKDYIYYRSDEIGKVDSKWLKEIDSLTSQGTISYIISHFSGILNNERKTKISAKLKRVSGDSSSFDFIDNIFENNQELINMAITYFVKFGFILLEHSPSYSMDLDIELTGSPDKITALTQDNKGNYLENNLSDMLIEILTKKSLETKILDPTNLHIYIVKNKKTGIYNQGFCCPSNYLGFPERVVFTNVRVILFSQVLELPISKGRTPFEYNKIQRNVIFNSQGNMIKHDLAHIFDTKRIMIGAIEKKVCPDFALVNIESEKKGDNSEFLSAYGTTLDQIGIKDPMRSQIKQMENLKLEEVKLKQRSFQKSANDALKIRGMSEANIELQKIFGSSHPDFRILSTSDTESKGWAFNRIPPAWHQLGLGLEKNIDLRFFPQSNLRDDLRYTIDELWGSILRTFGLSLDYLDAVPKSEKAGEEIRKFVETRTEPILREYMTMLSKTLRCICFDNLISNITNDENSTNGLVKEMEVIFEKNIFPFVIQIEIYQRFLPETEDIISLVEKQVVDKSRALELLKSISGFDYN